jgi:hypothetical protein
MAHPDYIRRKAVRLRIERKFTIDEIAECLALNRTTVCYWVKDIYIPQTKKQSAARQRASDANSARARETREEAYKEGVRTYPELIKEPTFRDFVCMYIGEGSKRCRNTVAICNSDPTVVVLGSKWIQRLGKNSIRYSIQYHADQSIEDLRQFWSDHLPIDDGQINFQRKSNSNQLSGRKWRSRYGVLTVSMGDNHLRSRLGAWIDLVKAEWK